MKEEKKDEAVKEEVTVSSDNNNNKENNKLITYVMGIVVVSIVVIIIVLLVTDTDNNNSNNENKENTNTIVEKDNKEDTNTVVEPDKREENIEKDVTDENKIAELDKYLTIISSLGGMPEGLHNGLDESSKIKFTLSYLFNNNMFTKITEDTIPEKYIGNGNFDNEYVKSECILELKLSDFENVSKKLFGEAVDINLEKVQKAGSPKTTIEGKELYPCIGNAFDTELGTMYYNTCACGSGIFPFNITYEKEKYTEDNDYYYLYIKATIRNGDTKETTKDQFIITLDKNYTFVEIK